MSTSTEARELLRAATRRLERAITEGDPTALAEATADLEQAQTRAAAFMAADLFASEASQPADPMDGPTEGRPHERWPAVMLLSISVCGGCHATFSLRLGMCAAMRIALAITACLLLAGCSGGSSTEPEAEPEPSADTEHAGDIRVCTEAIETIHDHEKSYIDTRADLHNLRLEAEHVADELQEFRSAAYPTASTRDEREMSRAHEALINACFDIGLELADVEEVDQDHRACYYMDEALSTPGGDDDMVDMIDTVRPGADEVGPHLDRLREHWDEDPAERDEDVFVEAMAEFMFDRLGVGYDFGMPR